MEGTMEMLDEVWKQFESAFVPQDASEDQRADMRVAFFSGIVSIAALNGRLNDLPEDERAKAFAEINNELHWFRAELIADAFMQGIYGSRARATK
jgi:hypothetical protein